MKYIGEKRTYWGLQSYLETLFLFASLARGSTPTAEPAMWFIQLLPHPLQMRSVLYSLANKTISIAYFILPWKLARDSSHHISWRGTDKHGAVSTVKFLPWHQEEPGCCFISLSPKECIYCWSALSPKGCIYCRSAGCRQQVCS